LWGTRQRRERRRRRQADAYMVVWRLEWMNMIGRKEEMADYKPGFESQRAEGERRMYRTYRPFRKRRKIGTDSPIQEIGP